MSIDYPHQSPLFLQALCLGPEVIEVRASRSAGHVIGLLRNAIYLESNAGHIISIVDGEINGPLTLRMANLMPLLAALKASSSETFQATEAALHIEGAPQIAWSHAPHWIPKFPGKVAPTVPRLAAINALAGVIADARRQEGFGPLGAHLVGAWRAMPPPQSTPLDALSSRALDALDRSREAAYTGNYIGASDALIALIGLGPGLTPSGDDLVAGLVAALVWQARIGRVPVGLTRQLVEAVREAAPARTNRISARLLWHACEGVLYAPAMGLGEALLSGDTPATLAWSRRLFSIGHTTGVDLSIGLLTGTLLGVGLSTVNRNDTRSVHI